MGMYQTVSLRIVSRIASAWVPRDSEVGDDADAVIRDRYSNHSTFDEVGYHTHEVITSDYGKYGLNGAMVIAPDELASVTSTIAALAAERSKYFEGRRENARRKDLESKRENAVVASSESEPPCRSPKRSRPKSDDDEEQQANKKLCADESSGPEEPEEPEESVRKALDGSDFWLFLGEPHLAIFSTMR